MRRILNLICVIGLLSPQVPLLVPHHHHLVRDGEAVRTETHYSSSGLTAKGHRQHEPGAQVAPRSGCEETPHPEAVKEEPKTKSKVFLSAILQDRRLDLPHWVRAVRRVPIPTSDHVARLVQPRDCLGRAPPSA